VYGEIALVGRRQGSNLQRSSTTGVLDNNRLLIVTDLASRPLPVGEKYHTSESMVAQTTNEYGSGMRALTL
jgi:hypothetical protein